MSRSYEIPAREFLIEKYNTVGVTINSLSVDLGVSNPTLRKWLIGYDIQLKDATESKREANKLPKKTQKRVENAHKILSVKEWLYEQRITLRKSKELIAKEIGCSITVVQKYLDEYEIKEFKLNESEYSIKEKLSNRNYMESLYESGMTMEKIALEVGSSRATVSLYFKDHSIEAKPANSYERENSWRSAPEIEIAEFVMSITPNEVLTNRKILQGVEYDIMIPETKLAIEYNGLYSHCEKENETSFSAKKNWEYHLKKTELCEENSYTLFHIFGDQWEYKQDIVKSMIKYKLGFVDKKYYARQLIIKDVNYKDRQDFYEENHLQGKDQSKIAYGLYNYDELICCISFGVPRFNKKYDWELIRFATKLNSNVSGGFSRLLKHFRKNYNGSIISYSDRTYATGNLYKCNGFTFSHFNKPSYWYVKNDKRFPRTMFTKEQISRKFPDANLEMSEKEIMKNLKYNRIWDCGTIAWILE